MSTKPEIFLLPFILQIDVVQHFVILVDPVVVVVVVVPLVVVVVAAEHSTVGHPGFFQMNSAHGHR